LGLETPTEGKKRRKKTTEEDEADEEEFVLMKCDESE